MFALGESVDAQTALASGLANQVVPLEDLRTTAEGVAARLAKQPTGALMATKKMMRDAATILARMKIEGEEFVARLKTAEAREAFMAFAERRPPDFTKVG
jgi:enoyl-CoA hydratase/carnithine racemase